MCHLKLRDIYNTSKRRAEFRVLCNTKGVNSFTPLVTCGEPDCIFFFRKENP